ncbi:MAG: rhodanese-like domain-containing protein [Candidatus Thiodiazotropha sp. (ex Cardiolucina cf. quadrata)]|nr:rhodanese-like domain-containing protein [Candidatus Thiodiazotropha sp. (ex Cardiolucina cf. quadrata)]
MKRYPMKRILVLCLILSAHNAEADEGSEIVEAMEEYLEFVDYGGATIFSQQIPAEEWSNFFVVDTRSASQYEQEHIPGAVNIEWRQILTRRSELPRDKAVLVYCNTGSLSAQAGFALRLAGHENVRILQGGMREWQARGGFDAHARAMESNL